MNTHNTKTTNTTTETPTDERSHKTGSVSFALSTFTVVVCSAGLGATAAGVSIMGPNEWTAGSIISASIGVVSGIFGIYSNRSGRTR